MDVHAESQSYMPAYKGTVWIDPQNGNVMRIEMQGYSFPPTFQLDDVETAIDYEYTGWATRISTCCRSMPRR